MWSFHDTQTQALHSESLADIPEDSGGASKGAGGIYKQAGVPVGLVRVKEVGVTRRHFNLLWYRCFGLAMTGRM